MAGQVRLGDYVKLNSGEEGYVTDIGWRCTTFRAPANNTIIVPNAKLAQAIVTNYNLPEKRMATTFVVTVDYNAIPTRWSAHLVEVLAKAAPGDSRECWRIRRPRWPSNPALGSGEWDSASTFTWPTLRDRVRFVTS